MKSRLRELELQGRGVGIEVPFHTARDPVAVVTIRRWCDAMGATNPVHVDPDLAGSSRFGGVVAPLAMLDVWTKPGLAYQRNTDDPLGGVYAALDDDGLTSAVAVSSTLSQVRPLVPGDVVTSTIQVEAVSGEKATALGRGRFVTSRQRFACEGVAVGDVRFTVLKFAPPAEAAGAGPHDLDVPAAIASAPVTVDRDRIGTVRRSALAIGTPLPRVTVAVTTTRIVAGALMTSDYFDAHHDRDAARRRGLRDVFMNIHTTAGLLGTYAGDWLGPDALWRSMELRLGRPCFPGDVLALDGEIQDVGPGAGDAVLAVRAGLGGGRHADAVIRVDLPA